MYNRYSIGLLIVMITSALIGIVLLIFQMLTGFFFLLIAGLLCLGFKELKPSPLQIGIITVFGIKQPITVKGQTLVLDWLPINIIGVIPVEARTVNLKFTDGVRARCADGATVTGEISITYVPIQTGNNPILYDDIGQEKGVNEMLKDLAVDHIKEIARKDTTHTPKGHGYEWMTTNPQIISLLLTERLLGKSPMVGMNALGDTRTMGIKITTIKIDLIPSDSIRDTDEDNVKEDLQKKAEKKDLETFREMVDELYSSFVRNNETRKANSQPELPIPSYEELGKIVDKQKTLKAGARKVIEAGNLVTFTNTEVASKKA